MSKTELVIFKPKKKHMDSDLKIKLNVKRLYPTDSVKYLGVRIDNKLNWKAHIDDIAIKLLRANAMLYKTRDSVNKAMLKLIYFALFDSCINYSSIILGHNINTLNRLFLLQKKAVRTINFKGRRAHTNPLFKNLISSNFLTQSKLLTVYWPATMYTINYLLSLIIGLLFHQISISMKPSLPQKIINLKVLSVKTTCYGKGVITSLVIKTWNDIQKITKDVLLNSFNPTKLKLFSNNFF